MNSKNILTTSILGWCAISVILALPAAATQLEGEQRTEAIKTTAANCLDRSVKEADTRPYTLGMVDAYCTCFGTAIADGFSIEEFAAASGGMSPAMAKRREAMVTKCSVSAYGKAKP